jgi:hypothetical protein
MSAAVSSSMSASTWWTAGVYGLGLVLTLVLACWLTPRRWWRRPTAGNLALLGAGTLAFGVLFASLLPGGAPHTAIPVALANVRPAQPAPVAPALRYRAVDDLNLRSAKATGAPRLAVLPAGTVVMPTGAVDGDWWQVRARLRGRELEGWASSLWLRRVDERAVHD